VYYIGMLSSPIENIRGQAQELQQASAGMGRIGELFALQPRVTERVRAALPGGALGVAFEHVTFAYEDEGPKTNDEGAGDSSTVVGHSSNAVLSDIIFDLPAGKVLGLLGRTGSGKTTLTRLLFRLYDPTGGAVRVGGIDLRDTARSELRQRIGLVTQDVQLFHASVRDNLTFFDPSIPDATIERVLGDLGLLPWLHSLPEGLSTLLAPAGGGLSAGEAQILAFTRVFLRAPGLVILDEASSRLDPASEAMIEHAVDRLLRERTGIIIAHRLATVLRADDILILEDGHIREYGPRAALMDDPDSRFSELLRVGMDEVLA
ncbi:helicase, partial [Kouleothrix aurantiaca]